MDEKQPLSDGLFLSETVDALEALLADSEGNLRFYLGYSGWGPASSSSELAAGAWLFTEAARGSGPGRLAPDAVGRHPALAGRGPGHAPARRRSELMLDPALLESRIKTALPDAQVTIRDLTGTGDHFEARVVSSAFEGKTMVDQHSAVYAPLQDLLDSGELHALALRTYSPEQWKKFGATRT